MKNIEMPNLILAFINKFTKLEKDFPSKLKKQ